MNDFYSFFLDYVNVKFIVAYDEKTILEKSLPLTATLTDIKELLLLQWPKESTETFEIDQIRLFCMGKELDNIVVKGSSRKSSLKDMCLPTFAKHPTPINISIRPKASVIKARLKKKKHEFTCCCFILRRV